MWGISGILYEALWQIFAFDKFSNIFILYPIFLWHCSLSRCQMTEYHLYWVKQCQLWHSANSIKVPPVQVPTGWPSLKTNASMVLHCWWPKFWWSPWLMIVIQSVGWVYKRVIQFQHSRGKHCDLKESFRVHSFLCRKIYDFDDTEQYFRWEDSSLLVMVPWAVKLVASCGE